MKPEPRYKKGDKIGERYLVHKTLMGGMGEVYLCLDLEENYPYALKTFQQRYVTDTQRLRQAFEQEVATWVALERHPNIVSCFWMQIFNNQPFVALEWITGEEGKGADLRGWLRRGPLELKLVLEIAIDICNGLIHAQGKRPGLVHRDLKPENILMAQGGLAKITDFGLAQIVAVSGLETSQDGAAIDGGRSFVGGRGIAGTPAYMAPEQWRDEPLDQRTDIYALGVMLYEMLTGRVPFQVDLTSTRPATFQAWLRAMQAAHEMGSPPALPTTLPTTLQDLLHSALAKIPLGRPADLHEFITRLTALYQRQFDQSPPARSAPDSFTVTDYSNRGITYHLLGQHTQALADFGRAIDLDPNYAPAYTNRGGTYQALGQHPLALADYGRALNLNPNFAQAYYNRGNTYYALGRHTEALADYDRALDLDPNFAPAHVGRGNTYHALGQYAQALADFDRALDLDQNFAQAYYNRGQTYAALRQHTQALTDYTRTIELDPNFAQAYLGIGVLWVLQGRHKDALPYFEQAAQLGDPEGARAAAQIKQMLDTEQTTIGRARQALDAFVQANSAAAMRQAVARFPSLAQVSFMTAIERDIAQLSPAQRSAFEERLVWLRQIADMQTSGRSE